LGFRFSRLDLSDALFYELAFQSPPVASVHQRRLASEFADEWIRDFDGLARPSGRMCDVFVE
jgi:hypothetical protein